MPEILHRGHHLSLVEEDGWEFACRPVAGGVAVIAVTEDGELLLVEQVRIPVDAPVIELPAGLVGDDDSREDCATAAIRELEEETGYTAERIQVLATAPTSPGLTNEQVTLVRAHGVRRIGRGGGVGRERIRLHQVPLGQVPGWVAARRGEGIRVDHKIESALWWIEHAAHRVEPTCRPDDKPRMQRALIALDGLSVGDAFGQRFMASNGESLVASGKTPSGPWPTTDDTEMATALVDHLRRHGQIRSDELAQCFARRFARDPRRGYGDSARDLLRAIADGKSWRTESAAAFQGQGSLGNGAAMRAAPVGAWFSDDPERAVAEARRSAEITHAHPDGQAGAIAVAVAAAWASRKESGGYRALYAEVLARTPAGPTHDGIARAATIPFTVPMATVVGLLGNGSGITSADTVPLALYLAACHLDNFFSGLWSAVSAGGDRDTIGAIVGGILACRAGRQGIPDDWLALREPLRHDTDLASTSGRRVSITGQLP